jgi:hypothetical protein
VARALYKKRSRFFLSGGLSLSRLPAKGGVFVKIPQPIFWEVNYAEGEPMGVLELLSKAIDSSHLHFTTSRDSAECVMGVFTRENEVYVSDFAIDRRCNDGLPYLIVDDEMGTVALYTPLREDLTRRLVDMWPKDGQAIPAVLKPLD